MFKDECPYDDGGYPYLIECSITNILFFPQQPSIILLKEGTDTSQGLPQLISNINACCAIGDTVKTTLGPRGMDKLVYEGEGKVTISNDGATIMKLLDIVHPAAKTLVDIAKSQDAEVCFGVQIRGCVIGRVLKTKTGNSVDLGIVEIVEVEFTIRSKKLRRLVPLVRIFSHDCQKYWLPDVLPLLARTDLSSFLLQRTHIALRMFSFAVPPNTAGI